QQVFLGQRKQVLPSTSVSGTAEAGSSITVKAGTTVIGTATATSEGKYTVTIPKQKAGTKLLVTASDDAGNVSEAKEVTVKDVTAPNSPTVNEVTESSTSVSGTAEAGSSITVKAGTTVIGTATATSEGKYTVTIPKQKAGTKLLVTAITVSFWDSGSRFFHYGKSRNDGNRNSNCH
ncbi:Ig-like domain-containing protein, partial [Peribacillus simplex]|uniref:Ig-like domain-containing protein n=1 Tax=Peribacillus simplex TaxID=1478 RepID=UPI003337933C